MSRDNDMRNRIVLRRPRLALPSVYSRFFMTSCKAMRLNALLILLLSIAPAFAQDAAKPVAVVNGVRIEQQAFDQLLQQAIKQGSPDSAQLRGRVRDQLIARELFLQQATSRNLDTDPQVQAAVEEAKKNAMIARYLKDAIRPRQISEDELHEQYEKAKARLGPKEYKLRVIQLATEDKAKQIRARLLKKDAAFADLAKQESLSPSAQNGGELEWMSFKSPAQEGETGRLPLTIAQTVEKLAPGKISEPIGVKDMWWLVKLDEVRPTRVPTFEEARPQLVNALNSRELERATNELVQKLFKESTITQ
jgi:parvulin-like peptidyl-prolyl isomerase